MVDYKERVKITDVNDIICRIEFSEPVKVGDGEAIELEAEVNFETKKGKVTNYKVVKDD